MAPPNFSLALTHEVSLSASWPSLEKGLQTALPSPSARNSVWYETSTPGDSSAAMEKFAIPFAFSAVGPAAIKDDAFHGFRRSHSFFAEMVLISLIEGTLKITQKVEIGRA